MDRIVFTVALVLGLVTAGWVALGFLGSSWLALGMILAIAVVFLLGALELSRFRADTARLRMAVSGSVSAPASLAEWLEKLPRALASAVRLRMEGVRVALPGPALTPYLVGLLVMLGMLGTFLGMVVTFNGTVLALEGSADLVAIRAALAAPLKGLGLSFGTSVAGVACSAMLGLMSAICRRDRLEAVRLIDNAEAGFLRPFSARYQRQERFDAMQSQAQLLPDVARHLQTLADAMERRQQQINDQLLTQQNTFHQHAKSAYSELAVAVGDSLKASLSAAADAAAQGIRPVVDTAMAGMADSAARMNERLGALAQRQVDELSARFQATAQAVQQGWAAAAHTQALDHQALLKGLGETLSGFSARFENSAQNWVNQWSTLAQQSQAQQVQADEQRLQGWSNAMQVMTDQLANQWQQAGAQAAAQQLSACQALEQTGQSLAANSAALSSQTLSELGRLAGQIEAQARERDLAQSQAQATWLDADKQRLQTWAQTLESTAARLEGQWQSASEQALAQHQRFCEVLEDSRREQTELSTQHARQSLGDMARLLAQSEALAQSRIEAEARWVQQHGEHMDRLVQLWSQELTALRTEEATHAEAAVQRLGQLQSALAEQLATLGQALEAPMSRMMQTAAEVPQAASALLAQWRDEMSRHSTRDLQALDERAILMARIEVLLQALGQATQAQEQAMASMLERSVAALDQSGAQVSVALAQQAAHGQEVLGQLGSSAIELAALGEAFHHGVQLFSSSNERLVEALQRVETGMGQASARSDEQLAYYVAQAREVIDLSISSQRGIIEELRRLQSASVAPAEEAGA